MIFNTIDMKKIILTAAAVVMALLSANAQSDDVATRSLHGVLGYKSVTVGQGIDLVFDEKFRDSIYLEAPSVMIDQLALEVKGTSINAVYKKVKKDDIRVMPHAKLHLCPAFIEQITANGDCNIAFNQPVTSPKLQLAVHGESTIDADFKVNQLNVKLSKTAEMACIMACAQASISLTDEAKFTAKKGSKATKLAVSCARNSTFDGREITDIRNLNCSCTENTKADVKAAGDVTLSTNGNANLDAKVECNKLAVKMAKESNVNVTGTCRMLTLDNHDRCYFHPKKFEVETIAKLSVSGMSSTEVSCRGGVEVKASDLAIVKVLRCGGQLKINATGTSCVNYLEGTRISSMLIKDQATTKIIPAAAK